MVSQLALFGVLAASLPGHEPLNITIVGDEVNPHNLSDAELTQPADLEAALRAADSGLTVGSLVAVNSNCVDDGLAAMPDTDVLIYFAHRSASDCAGGDAQPQLTAATEALLRSGGGVVVFHHGLYTANGKDAILELLGGEADSIAWREEGRPVIAVSSDHFVTTHEVEYTDEVAFENANLGVPAADYPSYRDTPAESYPATRLRLTGDEDIEILFVSDTGQPELLGYDLRRPGWSGHTVFFQPGEYQPNAVDDRDGNAFQILANAIYYVGTTQDEPEPSGTTSGGDTTGAPDSGDTGDGESTTAPDPETGMSSDPTPATTDTDTAAAEDTAGSGGCRTGGSQPLWLWLGLPLLFMRQR